jgi:hypothetical protein
MLEFVAEMSPAAPDVERRILKVEVSGIQGSKEYELPADCIRCTGLHFNEGAEVRMRLIDYGKDGNCLSPHIHSFRAHRRVEPMAMVFGARCVDEVEGFSNHVYEVKPEQQAKPKERLVNTKRKG